MEITLDKKEFTEWIAGLKTEGNTIGLADSCFYCPIALYLVHKYDRGMYVTKDGVYLDLASATDGPIIVLPEWAKTFIDEIDKLWNPQVLGTRSVLKYQALEILKNISE